MRRLYDVSLGLLFIGVLIAGGGAGIGSPVAFRVGAVIVVVAVVGVIAYAVRPKSPK